jgi:hypothetical protein
MISEFVKELREYGSQRKGEIASLTLRAADTIEMLSEKTRGQEWIPCSERLPEEHEWIGTKEFGTTISDEVHITFDVNGERFVRTLSLQNGELSNYEKRTMDVLFKGWKMVAWMPLPEPWKEHAK